MANRKPIKLSVFKGWGSSETIDAKVNIYQVQHKIPDPLASVELEETLKVALRFSANVVRRSTYRESYMSLVLSVLFIWVFVLAILWPMISSGDFNSRTCSHVTNLVTFSMVFLWLVIYERFVLLPRSKERYEQVARELEAGFRAREWHLEFVAQDFDSAFSAVAFFKLTPITPATRRNEEDAKSTTPSFPNVEDEEAWVCASNFNPTGLFGCLRPQAPSLLDGVPVAMKPSVDVFLWGPLTEACVNSRINYFQNQRCRRLGVALLSAIIFIVAFVSISMYYMTIEDNAGPWYYLGMSVIIFFGYIYFYYGMLSITQAMVAKESFHPEMSAIVKEFEPKFADAGFRMEYVMEDQDIPPEFVRKGTCKSGQGFFRFSSATKQDYVKISDTVMNNGWIV
ncbi:MAG: hypothetical protein SGBAC_011329 [Bacillariaceae sp.]